MCNEAPTHEDPDCDADRPPYLTLAIPPEMPDDALMLVHDLLEALTYELFDQVNVTAKSKEVEKK